MGLICTRHAIMLILRKFEDLVFTILGGIASVAIIIACVFLDTLKLIMDIFCIPWDVGYSLYMDLTGQTKKLCEENPRFKEALTRKRHKYVY